MMSLRRVLTIVALIALCSPVWAERSNQADSSVQSDQTTRTGASSVSLQGWGVRLGFTDDADQVVGGVHFNLGQVTSNLRFQPDVVLGTGDDVTTLYGTVPVYYRFGSSSGMTPYAGGGVSLGWVDRDLPVGSTADGSDFEFGARATGGLEWHRTHQKTFFVELSLGFGDVHDAQVVGAWTF